MRALLAAAVTAAGGDMTRKWTTAEGLPENTVTALAQSTDGYLWITTPSGVARFDGIRFETYQSPDIPAMPPPVPDRMLVDADGVTWRGTDGGLLRIRPRLVLPAASEIRGCPDKTTPLPPGATARLLDSAGRVWTGTETNGLSVRLADGAVRRFAAEEGFPARHVSAIAEDNEGDIWVGTDGMGLWRISGTRVSYYRRRGPRGGEFVRALFCDSEGALWIGTRGNGITRMKEGQFTVLPSVGGLPGTTVSAFREDPRGRLWLASGDALVTFALEDFEAYAAGRATEVPVDAFRAEDGYEPCDAACPALDAAALAAVTSAPPPRVVWETPAGIGPFAPGTKEIAFSFTADRPGVADRIVFAARLLPTTEGWRSLGGARTVSFHNLPHGKYRLEVRARGPFGRLVEETDALTALGIPFIVRPGVSALTAATTGTGILLTRRSESRGFTAYTPRSTGMETPQGLFMSLRVAAEEAKRLRKEGWPAKTPCAFVFDAAGAREEVVQTTLGKVRAVTGDDRPGLLIVGNVATHRWPALGEFAGRRVLLTCSEAVHDKAALAVEDRGGKPIRWPLIRLVPRELSANPLSYDGIVLTSPSSVRIFFEACPCDRRRLPEFFTCGAGTDAELRKYGVASDVMPAKDFSAAGLIAEIRGMNLRGRRILRLRSAKAGQAVARALRRVGAKVDDVVLYDNEFCTPADKLPPFDDVFFASASAVESFLAQYGVSKLRGKGIYVMGEPTRAALPPASRSLAQVFMFGCEAEKCVRHA